MFFVNRNDGYITSFYNVFKTTNGGKSWSCYPFTKEQILYDVFFIDSKTGFLTGSKLMKTTNGGFDWFTHSQNWFSKVYFPDPTTGFGISGGKFINQRIQV
jgi:photosystem II stability/assembly factor-like uncharacterized protein